MKKIIFVLLAFACVTVYSQTYRLMPSEWSRVISSPLGTDTLAGTTPINLSIKLNKDIGDLYLYDHIIQIDSLGDGTTTTVTLQGSYDNVTWHTISTQTYLCTAVGSELRFTNITGVETWTESVPITRLIASDTAGFHGYHPDSIVIPAHTITKTLSIGYVAYPYQRFRLVGGGASAGADITHLRWAFIKPKK